jgi:hypothetical protein
VHTFVNLHVGDILPFVHGYHPFVSSSSAASLSCETYDGRISFNPPAYLTSTTSLSFPTELDKRSSRSRENFAPGNRKEVTITFAID